MALNPHLKHDIEVFSFVANSFSKVGTTKYRTFARNP